MNAALILRLLDLSVALYEAASKMREENEQAKDAELDAAFLRAKDRLDVAATAAEARVKLGVHAGPPGQES